ncbi:MAG: chitobiase/beta-hexosaminidase C-terminal domain-containing protein, partial [Vallitaleaceae bacterium]|nr:chitobiase/beta-hexosaminidase C-terminal domain-containing protein [Vallitaleaceae bacterium]
DEDGIRLPIGDVSLRAVMYDYNSGMYSPEVTADFVIEAQAAPLVDFAAGPYKGPLTLHFTGFDEDNATIYYTTDGTDPATYGLYYDMTIGILLETGTYELRATIYDLNSWEYSAELTSTYTVK